MKDYKTGSYNTERLTEILNKFETLERLNIFTYETIDSIDKLCVKAVLRQIVEVCKNMPYDGKLEITGKESINHSYLIYSDKNLKLSCSVFNGKDGYSFSCRNILEVKNDSTHLFDIDCIVTTQRELTNKVNEVLSVINKSIQNNVVNKNK